MHMRKIMYIMIILVSYARYVVTSCKYGRKKDYFVSSTVGTVPSGKENYFAAVLFSISSTYFYRLLIIIILKNRKYRTK